MSLKNFVLIRMRREIREITEILIKEQEKEREITESKSKSKSNR